jgi:predicted esterase
VIERPGLIALTIAACASVATWIAATAASRPISSDALAAAAVPTARARAGDHESRRGSSAAAPLVLSARGSAPELVLYPPRRASKQAPIALLLHGMCSEPEQECPALASGFAGWGWLVCPRATRSCPDGDATWAADPARSVQSGIERFEQRFAGASSIDDRAILIGFSLGALRAAELVQTERLAWKRLVLIGAKAPLAPRKLQRAGVTRLLLAAGERDRAYAYMRERAELLARAGISAEFLSLGDVGHELPADAGRRLAPGLAWVSGEAASCSRCE